MHALAAVNATLQGACPVRADERARPRLTPKKSRSWLAITATTNQEKAFCQGRFIVQCITSLSVLSGLPLLV